MNKTINIRGVPIRVAPDEECDEAEWWICPRIVPGEPKPMADAQEGYCTGCDCAVWFDPRPKMSKPSKICIQCATVVLDMIRDAIRSRFPDAEINEKETRKKTK